MNAIATPMPGAGRRLQWTISDVAAVAVRNLRHIPRVPEKLAMVSFQPVIFVLLFGYLFGSAITVPGGSYHEFVMAGIFTQMMVLGASMTATGVADDLTKHAQQNKLGFRLRRAYRLWYGERRGGRGAPGRAGGAAVRAAAAAPG